MVGHRTKSKQKHMSDHNENGQPKRPIKSYMSTL